MSKYSILKTYRKRKINHTYIGPIGSYIIRQGNSDQTKKLHWSILSTSNATIKV